MRTAWEIAREPDLIEAVVGLDALLRHAYVTRKLLEIRATGTPHSRAVRAIRLADGRAESPQESRLRVRLTLAGLPPPAPQFEVRLAGGFVARLDLAWPELKVACEYDGGYHADVGQFRADRVRLNRLVDAGWTIIHVTAPDLADEEKFARLVALLRGQLGRR